MIKEIFRLKGAVLLLIVIVVVLIYSFNTLTYVPKDYVSLVVYGDNIATDEKAFYEDDMLYLPIDVINSTIDEYIYYDKVASKVIITTYDELIKMKLNDNVMQVNFENKDIIKSVKEIEGTIYVPFNYLQEIYDVNVSYNDMQKVVTIDNEMLDTGISSENKIPVYTDITTDSSILEYVNKDENLVVYTDSLNHNRWYKIKTSDNYVGYVFKDSVVVTEYVEVEEVKEVKEKISMYWQYGNSLTALTDEEGVNVVSPTLYELKNEYGEVTSLKADDYVEQAKSYGYDVWPIITNGIDDVNYTAEDTSLLMNSESARETLIRNISDIIERDNLDGINIDFEAMRSADKDMFSQFIRELAPILRKDGKVLSVDVYFVNYIDRQEVGKAADYTVLMGYDQRGSWSDEAGSIAEVSWTDANVKSLINDSEIPPEKILLGIPLYTRMFTVKQTVDSSGNVTGVDLSTYVYTMTQALDYVSKNGYQLQYDEVAGQDYIQYSKGTTTYTMYIENEKSLINRVNVVNENSLGGIVTWRKGFETDYTFKVIDDNLER